MRGEPYEDRVWNGVTAQVLATRIAEIIRAKDGMPVRTVEHVHSPAAGSVSQMVGLLGSASRAIANADDGRLLGGGRTLPVISAQVEEYLRLYPNVGS
jgi:hypothetical protein